MDPRPFYRAGALGALLQLVGMLVLGGIVSALGGRPQTAAEAFAVYQQSPIALLARGDLPVLALLIGPYVLTAPALLLSLRREAPFAAPLCAGLMLAGVVGAAATESTFSLLHLAEAWEHADPVGRAQLLAAGEAVIAGDLWNSTAGYAGGFLLQGTGLVLSLLMRRSTGFGTLTAATGAIANGLDLLQHTLHPFAPGWSAPIQAVMGLAYLVWFPSLAHDFWRLARSPHVG